MKSVLINYAHNRYLKSQTLCSLSAQVFGFDTVCTFGRSDIGFDFYEANKNVLDRSAGAGFWLWKPYLILNVLRRMEDSNVLMYCDSGAFFVSSAQPLIQMTEKQNIVLFDMPYFFNRQFVKKRCFELMGCTEDKYIIGPHWNAAFQLYKKSQEAIEFVEEYLEWCLNPDILMDSPTDNEDPSFKGHRHDQSILSLMAIKHGIKPNLDPSQFGRPQGFIIKHHRSGK